MIAAKRILRYLQGIIGFGILFPKVMLKNDISLIGYSDSDW